MKRFLLASRTAMANTAVTVIDMEGELDTATASDLESELQGLFSQGRYKIVLNMKELVYISSMGFGVLVKFIKQFRENHGDIKITNVRRDVHDIFQLMELHYIFRILKTEEDGIREF